MPLKRYELKEQTIKSLAEVAWGGGDEPLTARVENLSGQC